MVKLRTKERSDKMNRKRQINFKIDVEIYKKMKIKLIMNDVKLVTYISGLITNDLEKKKGK